MVPQNQNMPDDILKAIRIFIVQKNGELFDKFERNLNLLCESNSEGVNLNFFLGNKSDKFLMHEICYAC